MAKKVFSFFASFCFLATFYLLPWPGRLATNVSAKDYSIKTADFKVQLRENGSADVIETRTYYFDGSYSWADEWINLVPKCAKCSNYQITNFELWEGSPSDSAGGQEYIESNLSSVGNFSITNDGKKFYIKWYYRANFEGKTFTLKYRIENATSVHQDISEFYWQLVGDKWDKGTGRVMADVYLPTPAPSDQIWAFGHGPLQGQASIPSNQKVTFLAENLTAGKIFEVRVLFPKLTNAVGAQKGSLTLQQILDEEKGFIEKTKTEKKTSTILLFVSIFLPIILFVVFIILAVRFIKLWRKEVQVLPLPAVNLSGKLHEPPSDLPPAAVEALIKSGKQFSSGTFLSMILFLVLKRIIKIKSTPKKTFFGKTAYDYSLEKGENFGKIKLKIFEEDLLEFIFDKAGGGEREVGFEQIKRYSRDNQSTSYLFFKDFKDKAYNSLIDYGLLENVPAEIKKKSRTFFLRSLLIIFLSLWNFLVLAITTIIILLKCPFGKRRTEKGRMEVADWLAFKKWLKEYSVTKNYPVDSIVLWEKYLVYGTLFGISLKALSSLPISFSQEELAGAVAVNYGVSPSGDFGNFSSSLAASFQSLNSSFSNSFSGGYGASGVGSSGGFSGGGGGGGGAG